jgi:hypothetical protein
MGEHIRPIVLLQARPLIRPFDSSSKTCCTCSTTISNFGSLGPTARAVRLSRRDILRIITALIENAASSTDKRTRGRRYSRGLNLWATLLGIISELEGDTLERSSRRWPASLQRRFLSARYYCVKKRWPYSPYGSTCGQRIEHREIAAMYGLHSPVQAPIQTVATGPWRS